MKRPFLTAIALTFLFTTPSVAQDQNANLLSFGLGWWDILDNEDAVDARVEYRMNDTFFWKLKPWIGGELTSELSAWAGGGILADFDLGDDLYLTPCFGAGIYSQGSSDLDLDYPIQFRSQIEIGKELENGARIGAAFSHISNSSLGDSNPGTEVLNFYYHIPWGDLF